MNFSHIRYIVEVENTGSITKAAANLYMGQPNLSKAIRELESEIGITIFKRTAKGVVPTRKGEEFLAYAKTILSQINELESLYKPQKEESVQFSVAVPRVTYISIAFTEFIRSLEAERQLSIHFKETSDMTIINEVSSGEAQMGIIRFQTIYEDYFLSLLRDHQLEYRLLWEFEMQLLMSRHHELADLEDVPFHMLNGYVELVQSDLEVHALPMSQIRRSAQMEQPPKRIHIYERGSQFDLLQNVHNTYMWVSPVPQKVLDHHDLVLRRCSLARDVNKDIIIYSKGHTPDAYESLFIGELFRIKESLDKK